MHIIVAIASVLCGIFTVYYAFTCLGGLLFRKRRETPVHPPRRRVAAVIAARNEAGVIGRLVESLLAMDYPRELYDIYVIPNNCTDDTEARARAAGAEILHVDGPIHAKGDVLRGAFAQLTATGKYDAYCVFDADNLVDPGFFQAVNDALEDGLHVAQGFRDSKNPYDSWVSGSMSVFYWFMSRFYNESRARLNVSCSLNGTGFMVSDALIRTIGWNTRTLTEDLEFTALCALHGYRVGWMPRARVYDEQTRGFWDSCVQRRRWTAGSMQCLRRYTLSLFRRHSIASLDMGLLFLGNLLCVIGLIPAIGTIIDLAPIVTSLPPWLPLATAALLGVGILYYLACCAAAALLYRAEGRLNRRAIPGIFGFPLFMVSWMPVNLVAVFTPPPRWKEIRHTRAIDRPDVGENK